MSRKTRLIRRFYIPWERWKRKNSQANFWLREKSQNKDKSPNPESRKMVPALVFSVEKHTEHSSVLFPLRHAKPQLWLKKLCLKCLSNEHFANKCQKTLKCRKCQGNHLTLLCFKQTKTGVMASAEISEPKAVPTPEISCFAERPNKGQ